MTMEADNCLSVLTHTLRSHKFVSRCAEQKCRLFADNFQREQVDVIIEKEKHYHRNIIREYCLCGSQHCFKLFNRRREWIVSVSSFRVYLEVDHLSEFLKNEQ